MSVLEKAHRAGGDWRPGLGVALVGAMLVTFCGGTPTPVASTPPVLPVAATVPVPALTGCRLPKGTGSGLDCPRTSPTMMRIVEDAVNRTREARASEYPLDDLGYRVTTPQLAGFFDAVVESINASGEACAARDGLELAVKSTNAFSEQYKFWVTSEHLRLGDNAYRATCTPAWF